MSGKAQLKLTFDIDVNRGAEVTVLRPGAVKTPVGSGELRGGMLDPDGADVAGAPGHVAFVFGESGLPVYRPVAFAP